jgi:hypothetical protein
MDFPHSRKLLNFYPLLVSNADVCKAITRQKPSESVGLDDIP